MPSRLSHSAATGLAALAAGGVLVARDATAQIESGPIPFSASALASDRVISRAVEPLTVTSPVIAPGGPIPDVYTSYGKSLSPPIQWTDAPAEARAFVVLIEDPDGHGPEPVLHWLAYNIPGDRKGLPRNVRNQAEVKAIHGMLQGVNSRGGIGYFGPHPPAGDSPHHYHIEVFALDRPLRAISGKASRDRLIEAMDDRVLAEGELVGTYQAPAAPVAKTAP